MLRAARRLCVLAVCGLFLAVFFAGCERLFLQPSPPTDNASVFDSMWETVDRRYTFFEFKRIDWDALRARYRPRAVAAQSDGDLFAVLAETLNELQDDHTNLISQFNISRARPFFNDSANFDREILDRVYLKNQEFISGSLVNAVLERGGKKYGYIRYDSFSSPLDTASWNAVVRRFREQKVEGAILDLRDNGGGALANVLFLASRLAKARSEGLLELVKNGPGRNDYDAPRKIIVRVDTALRAQAYRLVDMRVAVLTNRNSYSAASFLPAVVKAPEFDHVKLIGDHTGGGSGLPVDFQLPNAWT